MKCYNSKNFRQNNYFTLYDLEDNFLCYFDNYDELKRVTNLTIQKIVYYFNHTREDFVKIVVDNSWCKLYTFTN